VDCTSHGGKTANSGTWVNKSNYSLKQKLVHAINAYSGIKVLLHSFLTLALHTDEWSTSGPSRFTSGKGFRYQPKRRLGGPQIRSGLFAEEKNISSLLRFEARIVQLVA
jgi:hypothetical protein